MSSKFNTLSDVMASELQQLIAENERCHKSRQKLEKENTELRKKIEQSQKIIESLESQLGIANRGHKR